VICVVLAKVTVGVGIVEVVVVGVVVGVGVLVARETGLLVTTEGLAVLFMIFFLGKLNVIT